jgi:hypothetical protein
VKTLTEVSGAIGSWQKQLAKPRTVYRVPLRCWQLAKGSWQRAVGSWHQIKKLQNRGLNITDISLGENYLLNIGYYRLSGYRIMILRKSNMGLIINLIICKFSNISENIFVQSKKSIYFCINMSIPLPIRTGRLGWTSYLYIHA